MYVRPAHREERLPVLHDAIENIRFGTLITMGARSPIATHIPMFVNTQPAPLGTIFGHIARQNTQWQQTVKEQNAIAAFVGPHAYISPSLYETKSLTGKVVPTWMYIAIQASGPIEFFEDGERLRTIVRESTRRQERARAAPWAVEDAPEDYVQGQLRAIVGFELRIEQLDGAWKFAQKKTEGDRLGVADGLQAQDEPVSDLVRKHA